jgi:glycosyltransferase involved in cell wall biosynthesis
LNLEHETLNAFMRIAYLLESTELSGGVKVVGLQAEALARRGHRVTVVSPQAPPGWLGLSQVRFEHSSFRDSLELARCDVRVATFWTTVTPALSEGRGLVFHLCQGYEGSLRSSASQRESIEEAYRAPTRKLAISATLAQRLDSLGFGPATNVGQAFDARPFYPAPPRSPAAPTVLLVGASQANVRGIQIALEGLRLWRGSGGRFRVCRVSPDPPSAEEHASGIVDAYHRALDSSRMPFAYRAADLFIGPSPEEESFGLPVLEALATGLPTLLSDTPIHREIAGEAAWYFTDGQAEALAIALPRLTTEAARRRAREMGPPAATRFDPASVAERLEEVFERALAGEGPREPVLPRSEAGLFEAEAPAGAKIP